MSTESKTQALRKAVMTVLATTSGGSYYRIAPDNAVYPYKVFDLRSVSLGDMSRDDVILTVDVWDHSPNPKAAESIADALEDCFNAENIPQENILPTFFRESRNSITETGKTIQHIQLQFLIQNYTR